MIKVKKSQKKPRK